MILIQILTVLFVAFAASRVILRYKDSAMTTGTFVFWMVLWGSVLVAVFRPELADHTATVLGLQRGTDAMFFLAVILLFYLIFRLYVKIDILDRDITRLTAEVSTEIHRDHKKGGME